MPYDPRPISQGGNRAIDEEFCRNAPKGKYRVVGVDTFDGGDWHEGDFDTEKEALDRIRNKAGEMTKMYVYDDTGHFVASAGKF